MKNKLIALALLVLIGTILPSSTNAQFGAREPQFNSPEISSEGQVIFKIHAPKAKEVVFAGGDIPDVGSGKPMTKTEEGIWEISLDVEPGYYRYHFSVDGVSVMDPRNPSTSQSFRNSWSLVSVPGEEFMDTKDVPRGAISEVTYYSKSLQRFRRMHVYTPPGYEKNTQEYPVFYLLHGAFDCDDSWPTVGRAGFIMDNLIAEKKAKPMVIVMPAGHAGPMNFSRRVRVDEFGLDFVKDIMPYVEKHYRVSNKREHRAIAGLSMGGSQTLTIGIPNLDKFSYMGVFSSGIFGITGRGFGANSPNPSFEEMYAQQLKNEDLKKGLKQFWFATGKDDFLLETSQATVKMLKKYNFDVTYHETEGGHNWIVWREYLHDFAQLLFQE